MIISVCVQMDAAAAHEAIARAAHIAHLYDKRCLE
jgi:hypothetical protein